MSAMEALVNAVLELAAEDLVLRQRDETPHNLAQTINIWLEDYEEVPPTRREVKFYEAHEIALDRLIHQYQLNLKKTA